MKGDNCLKRAARLRAAAKRVATRGILDYEAERDLFQAGIDYRALQLTRQWQDFELACTERVLLCLFGAFVAADHRQNVHR